MKCHFNNLFSYILFIYLLNYSLNLFLINILFFKYFLKYIVVQNWKNLNYHFLAYQIGKENKISLKMKHTFWLG